MAQIQTTFNGIIPQELIDSIKENKCVLFVGAGLSSKVERANGKTLPNWEGLLKELLDYSVENMPYNSLSIADLEEMIGKGNYLMAAQELQLGVEKNEFNKFFKETFRDPKVSPSAAHKLLPQIPFRSIMTSNYDNLIEGAYSLAHNGRIPITFTQEDLAKIASPLRQDDFYIFKIHGNIDRPETIVLGSRDYQKLFFRLPEYRQFIETLFSVYTFLFIGFGASDPDLDNVLDRLSSLFERTIDKHFILLPKNKFNLTEKKRLVLDKRIAVIEYEPDDKHTQVDFFLQDIANRCKHVERPEDRTKKYDVFISHSSKDKKIVRKITSDLIEKGYKVWNFEKEVGIGNNINVATNAALNDCRLMMFLITENYKNSPWLQKELTAGLLRNFERKLKVFPLVIGDINRIDLPSELSSIMYMKVDSYGDEVLTQLIKALGKKDE